MADLAVEFRDVTADTLARHSSGIVAVTVMSAIFGILFAWAWRRDNALSQQKATRKSMVCVTNTLFGPQLVPEDNSQYEVINDFNRNRAQKIWHILKLRLKHKHRWVALFTRKENTRYQGRERVLVLYTYMMSVLAFGAIFHGQKGRVAGVVDGGIFSSLLAMVPTFCVAQLFKNSRSAEPAKCDERKKTHQDYDDDSVDLDPEDEYASQQWNNAIQRQKPSKCWFVLATLCGGHLNTEDPVEDGSSGKASGGGSGSGARGDRSRTSAAQFAFSPTVNLFAYFLALTWIMECSVLIVAFAVQFDLVAITPVPEATTWALTIIVAVLWDFFVNQPVVLLVLSSVTVFTTRVHKSIDWDGEHQEINVAQKEKERKKVTRRESSRKIKGSKKDLRLDLALTLRGVGNKRDDPHGDIKTRPVNTTLGRTRNGAMREMRGRHQSARNFTTEGDTDTKFVSTPRAHTAGRWKRNFEHVQPATPSNMSMSTPWTTSSVYSSSYPETPRVVHAPAESSSNVKAYLDYVTSTTPKVGIHTSPREQKSPSWSGRGIASPVSSPHSNSNPFDSAFNTPEPSMSEQRRHAASDNDSAAYTPETSVSEQREHYDPNDDYGDEYEEAVSPFSFGADAQARSMPPNSADAEANNSMASPSNASTIAPLEIMPNVTHPSFTPRADIRSPSFAYALNVHKKKRHSIQPPNAMSLAAAAALGSPSGKFRHS